MNSRPALTCISSPTVPPESTALLQQACEARDVPFSVINADAFEYEPGQRLAPGDMVFRAAVSAGAASVERFLAEDHVVTFYREPEGVFFDCADQSLWLKRCGVPVPLTLPCHARGRERVSGLVDRLGGLPVVVKVSGDEGGVGTMIAESMPALLSLLDFVYAQGALPRLQQFVPNAEHWRIVVVGDGAVAGYRNVVRAGDFRSSPSRDAADYTTAPATELARLAVAATAALGTEFGGVDILCGPDGDVVLEVNTPCYYAQAQRVAGIDVAGAMVDHLLRKSSTLRSARHQA